MMFNALTMLSPAPAFCASSFASSAFTEMVFSGPRASCRKRSVLLRIFGLVTAKTVVQGFDTDTQHLSGAGLVVVKLLEGFGDQLPLHFLDSATNEHRLRRTGFSPRKRRRKRVGYAQV